VALEAKKLDGDADFDTGDGNTPEGYANDPEFDNVFDIVHRDEAPRSANVERDCSHECCPIGCRERLFAVRW
jgi:hypothetical protein